MNKIIKRTSLFLLSLATVFTIVGCGKKDNNKTKTNPTTTKVVKAEASVAINSNLEDVTVKAYNASDGKELDLTKKYATNTKIKVEVINKSDKNINLNTTLGQNVEIEAKTKQVLDEITLTNDLTITTKVSELVFVHLSNDEYVTFSGYYYDKNNKKVEFDSSTAVEKNTKVYLKVTNDRTSELTCIASKGDAILDYVTCESKGGHKPKTAEFTSEGITVTDNIKVSYRYGDEGEIYLNCEVESVSVVFKNVETNTEIEAESWGPCYEVDNSTEVKAEISNPNAKKLAIVLADPFGVYEYLITEETSYTFNFLTLGAIDVGIYEYDEYTFSVSKSDELDAYFYYYDLDGMEVEVKNGDKIKVGMPIDFLITNNSIYEAEIEVDFSVDTWDYTIHAGETFDSKPNYYTINALGDVTFEMNLTETVTQFYKVTFETSVTLPSTLKYNLAYFRGMYDYPEAEFNTDIAAGTEMVVVIENKSGVYYTIKAYNADTNEFIDDDPIYGVTDCAFKFVVNSNIKIVIE